MSRAVDAIRLVLAVCLLSNGCTFAKPVAGIEVEAPLPRSTHTETYWDTLVADPWRHLENLKDPTVQAWMRGQADATKKIMDRVPGRKALLDRIQEIEGTMGGTTSDVTRSDNGRLFFLRRNPGEDQFKLVWREGPDGRERVLLDPEALSKAQGRPYSIMDFQPSPDGTKLAYSIESGGGEVGVLHVVEVDTGRSVSEPIDGIRYASTEWLQDGSGFFYSRLRDDYASLPPSERNAHQARRFHAIAGKPVDHIVFGARHNPELGLPPNARPNVFQVPGTRLAAAWISFGVDRKTALYLADLSAAVRGNAKWRKVFDVADEISDIAYVGPTLYLRSGKGAPRFRILSLGLRDAGLSKARVAVAESEAAITEMKGARDGLYFTRLEGVNTTLHRLPARGGTAERIALPVEGHTEIAHADPRQDGAILKLTGWTRATKVWAIGAGGKATRLPLAHDGQFDELDTLEAREVTVRSHDGARVPMSIIARKGLALDGTNPTVVFGYGAYGRHEHPTFFATRIPFIERGGVFAVVHARGGGAFGKSWHDAGKKATKANTWKDGIAAAEWLIANGWTSRDRIGIYGFSAGGIFVGRAITERPELFAAAVPVVGALDALRFEVMPIGLWNTPEFGTTTVREEFHALLAMSSYHHIKEGVRYPAVMLSHGVNDTRVEVWQSTKFASRLVESGAGNRPVLLRLDYETGHGPGATRKQEQERAADVYSFFLWQFGISEFQPQVP